MKRMMLIMGACLLAGCHGDGNPCNGLYSTNCVPLDPNRPTNVNFTNFKDISANQTVTIRGIGAETTYTSTGSKVTSIEPMGPTGTASAKMRFDGDRILRRLEVSGPSTTRNFDQQLGADFTDHSTNTPVVGVVSGNRQDVAVAANPYNHGFEWQTFGAWETGRGTGVGTAGALSVGSETRGSNIPTQGSAIFTGVAGGIYVDQNGDDYIVGSNAALVTDFAARSARFTTVETRVVSTETGNVTRRSDLNMSGDLTYSGGTNGLTGTVTSDNMAGTVNGRFYGPNAEEAGGIFALRGQGVEGYLGGFGVRRE